MLTHAARAAAKQLNKLPFQAKQLNKLPFRQSGTFGGRARRARRALVRVTFAGSKSARGVHLNKCLYTLRAWLFASMARRDKGVIRATRGVQAISKINSMVIQFVVRSFASLT